MNGDRSTTGRPESAQPSEEDDFMLLPRQAKPIVKTSDHHVPPAAPPPGVVASIIDPCQLTCGGSGDPGCWQRCSSQRSPWIVY
jgi:hypothetical protein